MTIKNTLETTQIYYNIRYYTETVKELDRRFDEFGNYFTIIAVFDSPLDNLIRYAEGHKVPFPILADENNEYYREYGIEHSVLGILAGKRNLIEIKALIMER